MATLGLLLLIMAGRAHQLIQQDTQREITIYHSYKNSIADFISNKKIRTVSSIGVETRQIGFAASNHQSASGLGLNDKVYFRGNYEDSNLFLQQNFIQFEDKKMFVIDDENQLNHSFSIKTDYALVQNNPYIQIDKIKDTFQPKIIIFDASNSRKAINVWKQQCEEIGLAYHDINEKGAWTVEF